MLDESSLVKCKNLGCEESPLEEFLEAHMKACQFRPITCPLKGVHECIGINLTPSIIKEHLVNIHKASVNKTHRLWITVNMLVKFLNDPPKPQHKFIIPNVIEYDGNTFLIQIFGLNRMLYFVVVQIGNINTEKKYAARVSIQPGNDFSVQWTIEIPLATSFETIYKENIENPDILTPTCSFGDLKHLTAFKNNKRIAEFVVFVDIFNL